LVAAMTLVTELALGVIPPDRAGAGSAMLETCSEFGGALGIALLGSIGSAVYGARMAGTLPADLPTNDAHDAAETLAGAIVAAGRLGGPLGARVLEAGRSAFAESMHAVAVSGAVVLIAAAVSTLLTLRRRPVSAASAAAPQNAVG
jgi:DHA2 family multidrug resistance protein-like MFS transporter